MILHLKDNVSEAILQELAEKTESVIVTGSRPVVLVTPSGRKEVPKGYEQYIDKAHVCATDMQLSDIKYYGKKRTVKIGDISIGGETRNTLMMAGPCSVESEEQITQTSELLKELNISVLRAGCYKPRTSPYSFQGMGLNGLKLLDKIRSKYNFKIISEVRDSTHIDEVIEYADIIQIGAKSMYDHGILRKCGSARKPVLLKRGFGTTLQEFVQASEFILSGGNDQVLLCERGIRTFENKSRFTLDLCGVAFLKEYSNLPVVLDPSHAMGYAYGVADLARACTAMGVDGLLIEVHPDPKSAKSDAAQQLNHDQFKELYHSLKKVAASISYSMV